MFLEFSDPLLLFKILTHDHISLHRKLEIKQSNEYHSIEIYIEMELSQHKVEYRNFMGLIAKWINNTKIMMLNRNLNYEYWDFYSVCDLKRFPMQTSHKLRQ